MVGAGWQSCRYAEHCATSARDRCSSYVQKTNKVFIELDRYEEDYDDELTISEFALATDMRRSSCSLARCECHARSDARDGGCPCERACL